MRSMPVTAYKSSAAIESVEVAVYRVPTDLPEADGTFAWDSTTIVIVQIAAGGEKGMGYTYADAATARVIADLLADQPEPSHQRRQPGPTGNLFDGDFRS